MALNIYQNTIQGRIAIGEKNKEKGYPMKLDHFVFTKPFDPKAKMAPKFPEMTEIIKQLYKTDKPKAIKVTLVDHHPDEVFYTDYMNYPGTKCNCKGNGERATRTNDAGEKKELACNYDACTFRMTKTDRGVINTCKPTGILTFMMPEAPVSGGLWKFTTHSIMSIGKIAGALKNIYAYRKTLFGLQVILKVTMVQINIKGSSQNVPTVELEVPFSWDELAEGAGTTIGTLMEAKAKYLSLGYAPDPQKMKELSTSAEVIGYDGSMEGVRIVDIETTPDPPEPPDENSDEFTF